MHEPFGGKIPSGTRVLDRTTFGGLGTGFGHIGQGLGQPTNRFLVRPRHFGRNEEEEEEELNQFFFVDFFYPFYFDDPFWFGFGYPGYYPSVYSYYGWGPGWIYPDRVYYDGSDYVYHNPYRYYAADDGMDYAGAEQAINDIRRAWLDDDLSLLSAHLTDRIDIRVYFNGQYSYTTATEDYYGMTSDTISTIHTQSLDFGNPVWISSQEVFYAGSHVFSDPDGTQHTVYVSYRLRHLGSDWHIVAIGTSTNPLESHYSDYRDR